MSTDNPLALDPSSVCTLPPEGLEERAAWVQREILPHALTTTRLRDGLAIELRDSAALRERLDRWIALERDCCSGIAFERLASATPELVRFEIRGVDPDAPLLRALGAPREPESVARRIAKATGAGLTLSLFVCCVVPIAAGSLVGVAAAPLAFLDGPLPIAAGAVVGGVGTWSWLGRRRAARETVAAGCGPGC